jgi:hypothetical protein
MNMHMKIVRNTMLTGAALTFSLLAGAQTATEQEGDLNVRNDYYQLQDGTEENASGVASYNIDDGSEDAAAESQDGAWKNEGRSAYGQETETIHIYSGKQEGNNVVRTVQVKLPDGDAESNFSYREYQSH